MSNIGNKKTMAKNLTFYIEKSGKTQRDICEDLCFSYSTFNDWTNAKKYPRIDKIEMLANYFGIMKSDLIEEHITEEIKKDNDIMADIIVRMRKDEVFFDVVSTIYDLDPKRTEDVKQLLTAFLK